MQLKLSTGTLNLYAFLRTCGYLPIHDRISGKNSFVRKLSSGHYPRFHLYVKTEGNEIIFNLHLDQNANRYQNQNAHNADYDSDKVKAELERINQLFLAEKSQTTIVSKQSSIIRKPAPKSWFEKLLGR